MICLILILATMLPNVAQTNVLMSQNIFETSPECDVILLNAKSKNEIKLLSNKHEERAKVFLTHNLLQPNKAKCNIMLVDIRNESSVNFSTAIAFADDFFYASRTPFKLVMFAKSLDEKPNLKKAYDYQIVTNTGVQKYVAIADIRWRELRAAYTVVYPYLALSKGGKWSGLDWDLWKVICDTLRLKLNMAEKHSSYTSAYANLADKSVDLTLPQNPFSHSLLQVSEQTTFTFYETYSFYNIIPGPVNNMLTLFHPFNGLVWACSLAAFMFAFLAIYLINLKTPISIFHSAQLILSPLLNEPAARNFSSLHNSWYGYVVLIMWSTCAILLSFAYISNLLANLTVVERNKADNTFEDLLKNKRTLAVPAGTFLEDWMKTSSREIIRQVEKECTIQRDGYYNVYKFRGVPPKMKDKLENGEASSLVLVSMFSNIAHKYRLGTDILRGTFSTYFLQLRHPMQPMVNKLLGEMRDTGIHLKFRQKAIWARGRPSRDFERHHGKSKSTRIQQLSIKHMYPLWIAFTFGVIVSNFTFLLEKVKDYVKRSMIWI